MELLKWLLYIFLMLFILFVLLLFNPISIIAIIIITITFVNNNEYKKSAYYQITKLPYSSVRYNTGRYGEYLTYKCLKHMEANGAKFLFNVYIPKENSETTEIDVIMICSKGIFVFESKNYSGWIFGNENQKNWYQTLPAGRGRSKKKCFYNPVMQNKTHLNHLRALIGEYVPLHSVIVFSDRCTLKNIQIQSNDVSVINRYNISSAVYAICSQNSTDLLNVKSIFEIFNMLYPYTQVSESEKAQHIANINNNLTINTAQWSQAFETSQQLPKCPWCNGNLVLRIAKKGTNIGNRFYGCSNFPKCKYTQNQYAIYRNQ